MALPSFQIARGFDFDALICVLDGIFGKNAGGEQVGMSIVIEIFDEAWTVFGNICIREEPRAEATELQSHFSVGCAINKTAF